MNKKIISKLLATMLVITLTFANVLLLGDYASKAFATDANFENQPIVTNNANVEFDAYYIDESGNKMHSVKEDINSEDLILYLYAKVRNGYLKGIKINMFGNEESESTNFTISNNTDNLTMVESIDVNTNTIKLKQLDNGTEVVIKVPTYANKNDVYDIANFNKQNNIKITATYIDNEGKEIPIEKTVKTNVEWTANAEPVLEQEVLKVANLPEYVNMQLNDPAEETTTESSTVVAGMMLQTKLRTGVNNNNLPIQETNINVEVPTIDGIKPVAVTVIANQTKATNGKNGYEFGTNNWSYNNETGILTINVKNEPVENKISWDKNNKDEYIVTYIYPQDVLAKVEPELQVPQKAELNMTVYGSNLQQINMQQEMLINLAEQKGNIISSATTNSMEQLSKGYFYSHIDKNTEYTLTNFVQIANKNLVDSVIIENKYDELLSGEEENIIATSLENYSTYSMIQIKKEIFDTILGEEGYLEIYNANGNLIYTINKDTTVENGNYIYKYEENNNSITIKTSKPIAEGNLIIQNVKTVNSNTNFTAEQIASYNKLKTNSVAKLMYKEQELSAIENSNNIALIEPQTKIEAEISQKDISTIVENKNVQIKTILKTNDETCMLYENPVIQVELPNYIEDISLNSITLGYDEELIYDSSKVSITTNENGNKVVTIVLTGKDTDYNFDNVSKGANLVIDANLTVKKLTPTTNSNINVSVQNNNGSGQVANAQIPVTAVAPVGVVATTQISGYNEQNTKAMALNGQDQTVKLPVKAVAKVANVEMNIINNYNNVCKNISILGSIPYNVAKLNSPITINGVNSENVVVYYSSNENATKDLNVAENGWTTAIENIAEAKSYLVVINGYEMTTGQNIVAGYNLLIPENLGYNIEDKLTYTVYYDNVTEEQTIKDYTNAARTIMTTGAGPELSVAIKSNVENGAEVKEGSEIKYTVSVTNTGKTAVENVTAIGTIPEGTKYFTYLGTGSKVKNFDEKMTEYSEKIASIAPGETKTIEYSVWVKSLEKILAIPEDPSEYEREDYEFEEVLQEGVLEASAKAVVEGFEEEFKSGTITNKSVEGYMNVSLDKVVGADVMAEGESLQYNIYVENVNKNVKRDVVVTLDLPLEVKYNSSSEGGIYDADNHRVIWNLGSMEEGEYVNIKVYMRIADLPEGVTDRTITNKAIVRTADREMETGEVTINIKKASLSIQLSTDAKNEVAVGDTMHYNIKVQNNGGGDNSNIAIGDTLPEGLIYNGSKYTYNGTTYSNNSGNGSNISIRIPSLSSGESVEIDAEVKVKELEQGESSRQIKNIATVYSKEVEQISSNEVTNTIVNKGGTTSDDPSTGGEYIEGTHKITGTAWLDENKNGVKDEGEQKLSNITVMLIDATSGQVVKDTKTGTEKKQTTTQDGTYNFSNIENGKYIVAFLYDNVNYNLAEYKKDGVLDTKNSDVISTSVNLDGTAKPAAASDIIEITNEDASNIDMGLVLKSKFNLTLDKSISKVTVKGAKQTKTYDYANTKLAKVDLDGKTAAGTVVVVEYKIVVSNISDIAGYAKKVADYVPSDMKFSSELNKDWYTSDNGTLYNSSLANAVIEPGQTKELTLVLTKTMTADNFGIVNNRAEIYEAYNDLGIADEDSTPANKVDGENDMSSADLILGPKTGEVIVYMALTVTLIVGFAVGIYFIKRKVLTRV